MKLFKMTVAVILAGSMLTLTACRSGGTNKPSPVSPSETVESAAEAETGKLSFSTRDIDGKTVTMADFSEAKVIMFNMWEPWCGPCRQELPDLQKLYKKYSSQGLMIIGVYSDVNGLKEIIAENKLKYPMIVSNASFDRFQTGYVPTTFFTDGEGNVLSDEPYIGSKSYEEWESVILSYLK